MLAQTQSLRLVMEEWGKREFKKNERHKKATFFWVNCKFSSQSIRRAEVLLLERHSPTMFPQRFIYSLPFLVTIIATAVVLFLLPIGRSRRNATSVAHLAFSPNRRFRVLQLTDLHLGEEPSLDWGPEQDRKTFRLLRSLIPQEDPDLVIFSGDQVTANNIDANATTYYHQLGDMMDEEFQIPYAMVFGNHDDMDREVWLANGTLVRYPALTSRRKLVQADRQHRYSLTKEGPSQVFGVSNYFVNVYDKDTNEVKLQIALLDSGGGQLTEQIRQSQLQWYLSQRNLGIESAIFQHIPTKEFRFDGTLCEGSNGDGGIAPLEVDAANETFFLADADPRLLFMAVGHNHGNSYCCDVSPVLCFGRHSGYGGYGSWERGARVFEFQLSDDRREVKWRSYVRMESGNITEMFPF